MFVCDARLADLTACANGANVDADGAGLGGILALDEGSARPGFGSGFGSGFGISSAGFAS